MPMEEPKELNDFTLTYFPAERKVVVFSYGNIYQSETNYKIAIVLKSIDREISEYFLVYLPLKEIIAFPLGTIVDNQNRTGLFAGYKADIAIDVSNKQIEKQLLYKIPQLVEHIDNYQVPEKINKFNAKFHIKSQWYYIFSDLNSGKKIYIPHYEVARKFYFTSPSMTRQILSAALEEKSTVLKGLYKNVEEIDSDTKEITLTQNAKISDAENIFRFATNAYSHNSWHQIRRNLTASAEKIRLKKEKNHIASTGSEMKLQVDFPVQEIIQMYVRCKVFDDGNILVLKILEEDTSYDFERLFVKIERPNQPDEPVGVINNEKVNKDNLSGKITQKKPNAQNESIELNIDLEEREKKLGLEGKEIIRSIVEVDPNEDVIAENEENDDENIDLSSDDKETNGDDNTASSNTNTKQEDEDKKDYLTLEDFKLMLFECAKEHKDFSFIITVDEALPQKPKEDKDKRRKWKKAKLKDEKTERRYLGVNITYKKRNFTIIEIQRDKLVEGLSTLIIYNNDNENINEDLIRLIGKNFVYNNGRWLKDFGVMDFKKDFLEHPKGENKNGKNDWFKRLIKKIK